MRINSKLGVQHATFDGKEAGEGLAIFLSQNSDSACRYRFLVKAMIGEGVYQVGVFYSSPPNATNPGGNLSRMVAAAVCPGATSWAVDVSAVPLGLEQVPADPETAEVILSSSKCCTSPVGVSRVGERFNYEANSSPGGTQNIPLYPGQVITEITLFGLAGGGQFVIGGAGDVVIVPQGATLTLHPKGLMQPNTRLAFTNLDWSFEFLESA